MRWKHILLPAAALAVLIPAIAARQSNSKSNAAASGPFYGVSDEAPGRKHHITVSDLPKPFATKSTDNSPDQTTTPQNFKPQAPEGFVVEVYASDLRNPRLMRTAPNGDVFLAESAAGRIRVLRGVGPDGHAKQISDFATGLEKPFGIAFYPPGPNPQYVYVGNTDEVVRFKYANGDLKASAAAEHIADLPGGGHLRGGGHWTRDIAFSKDGKTMFVSVGSMSNVDESNDDKTEYHRAAILAFTPDGKNERVYASGVRNAVGIAVHPETGQLWMSVNERDELGDNLVPDYISHVEEGGFYGWPWYYMGPTQDPRHKGAHPELKSKVLTPDVLVQPHSASLEMVFYEGKMFPQKYQGWIFAAEHGSWNRHRLSGYEVIAVPAVNGKASGEYEDFLTGFANQNGSQYGRPVGVAVMQDGSLLVSDDGANVVWRVTYGK